jgi:beta-lactamase superfamily II metal-dependent hydrolase
MIIDGGRRSAYKFLRPALEKIAADGERVELLVLTHIDADHIEGVLALAEDEALPVKPEQVWYNGFEQLKKLESFGFKQGDRFSKRLGELEWPLNSIVDGKQICVEELPDEVEIEGLKLRLVSPTREKLKDLGAGWDKWRTEEAVKAERARIAAANGLEVMGRKPLKLPLVVEELAKPTPIDSEAPNGSSIGFVATWDGKSMLLTGDAHPDTLASEIKRIKGSAEKLQVDLFKLSHHGSSGNTTAEVVQLVETQKFAISTSGSRHGHPDPEAIARVLRFGSDGRKTLYFTHSTDRTKAWEKASLRQDWSYDCEFAKPGQPISIEI